VDTNGVESQYSKEAQGTTIAEPQDVDQKEDTEDSWLDLWIILPIIIVIIIILILIYLKNRSKYKEEEPLFLGKLTETQEGEELASTKEDEPKSEPEEELLPPSDE
jgi:hypothetical protein